MREWKKTESLCAIATKNYRTPPAKLTKMAKSKKTSGVLGGVAK